MSVRENSVPVEDSESLSPDLLVLHGMILVMYCRLSWGICVSHIFSEPWGMMTTLLPSSLHSDMHSCLLGNISVSFLYVEDVDEQLDALLELDGEKLLMDGAAVCLGSSFDGLIRSRSCSCSGSASSSSMLHVNILMRSVNEVSFLGGVFLRGST